MGGGFEGLSFGFWGGRVFCCLSLRRYDSLPYLAQGKGKKLLAWFSDGAFVFVFSLCQSFMALYCSLICLSVCRHYIISYSSCCITSFASSF
jgi:hypothetical protein